MKPVRALAALLLLVLPMCAAAGGLVIRVMTFNAWGGGLNDGSGLAPTISAIRAADADFVGLQEVRAESAECTALDCPAEGPSVAPGIAEALGYHLVGLGGDPELTWATAMLSRHPALAESPAGLGALFDVDGMRIALYNIHLTDFPYQPYQATGIPYGDAPFLSNAEALVQAARQARGSALEALTGDLAFADAVRVTLITGDFNEPSHRDWTPAAAELGRHPLAVAFPTLMALEALGFADAYRTFHPDEIARPGFTWTPTRPPDDPGEHHDRIDFVLVRGAGARVTGAWVVGESPDNADIVVPAWNSDHRGVVVEVQLEGK